MILDIAIPVIWVLKVCEIKKIEYRTPILLCCQSTNEEKHQHLLTNLKQNQLNLLDISCKWVNTFFYANRIRSFFFLAGIILINWLETYFIQYRNNAIICCIIKIKNVIDSHQLKIHMQDHWRILIQEIVYPTTAHDQYFRCPWLIGDQLPFKKLDQFEVGD